MAAGSKSYTTNFLIGAKLLSSFQGAMNQAQSRMKSLEKSVKGVSNSIKAMTSLMVGALAAAGGRAIFEKIFEGAEEAAKAAEQRTRRMITSMLQLQQISVKGRAYAEAQVKQLQKHTEELAKHSVYSQDILNAGEDQLAVAAVPPKYIKQAIGPMQDLLATAKGVSATEEDMANLAKGFGTAIRTGMARPLREFGIRLSPMEQQYLKYLSKTGQLQEAYNFLLDKMKFSAGEAARLMALPEGRIKKAQERITEMGKRIKKALLPDEADMREAWTNAMLTLEPALLWFERLITHLSTWVAKEFGDMLSVLTSPDGVNAMNALSAAVEGLGAAFGITQGQGKSLGTMLGEWLVKEINQTTQDFIGIERVVMNVKRQFKILEGEFLGGWEKIRSMLDKVVELWEKFKKSITEWKPPWWMPGAAAVRGGQAIHSAGGGVMGALKRWNAAATARVGGGGGGALGNLNLPTAPGSVGSMAPMAESASSAYPSYVTPPTYGGGGAGADTAAAAAATGALPAGKGGSGVYQKLLTAYKNSGVVGTVPPDGAKFGITTGSAEEWARFGTAVASAESSFNPRTKNLTDPGGSFGVFQYAHGQVPGGNAYDVDASVRQFVKDSEQSVRVGSLHKGLLGRRFSTIGSHPDRAMRKLGQAAAIAAQVGAANGAAADGGTKVAGLQFGGIATRPMLATLAERGAEAVIPLGRGGGKGGMGALGTMLNFTPNITINGGSNMSEEGLVSHLRDLTREFIDQFQRAQTHSRRLSYEGGYG